jgi:zinc transporter 9
MGGEEMAGGSATAVYTAIGANSIVAVAKFIAFSLTGSGAMLSEGIHSVADVANQCLLGLGLSRSKRPADDDRPYGYDKERFVWALISAVGIFFLGCGVTLYHGIHSIIAGSEMHSSAIALGVLAFSFVIEGLSLLVAIRALQGEARKHDLDLMAYVQSGSDPTGTAVLLEDGAAVLGVTIAAACIGLGSVTGQPWWDGVGSILISLLLGWVAIWLINQNRDALVGRSVPLEKRAEVLEVLASDPVVQAVDDVKASMVGDNAFRFKAEVDFDGREIARRCLADKDIPALTEQAKTPEAMREILEEFGEEVVTALAEEVDRLEKRIREAVPGAQHLDIEAD